MVSKQQKLRASGQQNGQPSTNAALNGPQGRMAPLKPIFAPTHQPLFPATNSSRGLLLFQAGGKIIGAYTLSKGISPEFILILSFF